MPAVKSEPAAGRRLANQTVAAAYANVSGRTIYRWAATGRITSIREGASVYVKYDLDEIDEVIRRAR